jgi:hypothetical protein
MLQESIAKSGFFPYACCGTPNVFRELDEWIRCRLRALQLKRWKRGRTTYRELQARGLDPNRSAHVAAYTRRWWKKSATVLHLALPIRLFEELGLPRLGP